MEQNASSWKQPKVWLIALGLILITSVVVVSIIRDRIVNNQQWQVSVTGQGKIEYQPDIATVRLGVQLDRVAKVEDALSQLNEKMDKMLIAVKELGIDEADIQTQSYSLYPQYDYINEVTVLSGYSANQQLLVKVRNVDQDSALIGNIIAKATQAGANQVLGVSFDISNLEELKLEARLKAIADAKQKAGVLANAAGVRLGDIIGWWENIVNAPGVTTYNYADGYGGGEAKGGAVPTGKQEIIIEMNLNYKIK
jgi:uncharacterized protein YggE